MNASTCIIHDAHATHRGHSPALRLAQVRSDPSSQYHLPQTASHASCACGGICPRCARSGGESKSPTAGLPILRKLEVGATNDPLEAEADRIAEVFTKSAVAASVEANANNQLHRKTAKNDLNTRTAPPEVESVLSTSGAPLDLAVRRDFEPRFGRSFEQVRMHAGDDANAAARAVSARAFAAGNHLVFASGQYAPQTSEGRKLLAHELAHVAQQERGRIQPLIQRSLFVTGGAKDIRDFLGMLESGSGLGLKYDRKTKTVSITGSVWTPRSAVLALRLLEIIEDTTRHARINLGRTQQAVSFGAFPSDLDPGKAVQELRIDHFLALEDGVPGSGIALLAHEIVENYESALHRDDRFAFEASHEVAMEAENLVAHELVGPGRRLADFAIYEKEGAAKFGLNITDMEKYFIVYETDFKKSSIKNARRVPRIRVAHYRLEGFDPRSTTLPAAVMKTVSAISADMKKEPAASARLESTSIAGKTAREGEILAARQADRIQEAIVTEAKDMMVVNWRRFHVETGTAGSRSSVSITLDKPNL